MLNRSSLLSLLAASALLVACDASFDDLRVRADGAAVDRGAPSVDAGVDSLANDTRASDGELPDAAVAGDAAVGADLGPPDSGPAAGPVSEGSFTGVSGYQAKGTATVERLADGSFRLDFSSDFSVSSAPGMVVVMSDRQQLGTIQTGTGDVRIKELTSVSGAQSYPLSAAAAQRKYVQIFCEPFGVDIGHAELKVLP